MKYVPPIRLKVLMSLFFGTAALGIFMGLNQNVFMITILGVINLMLGGFFGYVFLTQEPKKRDRRKK